MYLLLESGSPGLNAVVLTPAHDGALSQAVNERFCVDEAAPSHVHKDDA